MEKSSSKAAKASGGFSGRIDQTNVADPDLMFFLGSYDRIEGKSVFFDGGDGLCAPGGTPRRSSIKFVEDCSVDNYIVECVNESPQCVYEMTVRGLCCERKLVSMYDV